MLTWQIGRKYPKKEPLDFQKILQQVYGYELYLAHFEPERIAYSAREAYHGIGAQGSFDDIPYQSHAQAGWLPDRHLTRLRDLALSYVNPDGTYYQADQAYTKIVNGLQFWQQANPQSTNWYMQEISTPQQLGVILVLMRFGKKQVPQELEQQILYRMKKTAGNPRKSTGANRAAKAVHYLYRGALTKKEQLIKIGAQAAYDTLHYTRKEGFQQDGSYHQHGPQLYLTGYGNAIIDALACVITATKGTAYAIQPQQLEPLQKFLTEAYLRVVRGHYSLYNVGGRSLSRENALEMRESRLLYKKMKLIDEANAPLYQAAIDRIDGTKDARYQLETGTTHFWRSDYTLHTAPGYTFDVRTVSRRTYRNENGNDENIKGYFLADGAYAVTVNGDEYFNLFPVWDFSMVPGTTTPYIKEPPRPKPWGTYGQSAFAGGLSAGKSGVAAYAYEDTDFALAARGNKSYFILDNMIVCIGSGISSGCADEMRTTLNQCRSGGKVSILYQSTGSATAEDGQTLLGPGIKGLYHDQVGYVFYDDNQKVLLHQSQSGTWTAINAYEKNRSSLTQKVFTLYESHGMHPGNGAYQYVLLPGIASAQAVQQFDKATISVLSSTKALHAVKAAGNEWVYAVFFEAGVLAAEGLEVQVDKPCILVLTESGFYLSNPDQSVKRISVTIIKDAAKQNWAVKMFAGKSPWAGKTIFTAYRL